MIGTQNGLKDMSAPKQLLRRRFAASTAPEQQRQRCHRGAMPVLVLMDVDKLDEREAVISDMNDEN